MKQGKLALHDIEYNYSVIDKTLNQGHLWELYEHKKHGDVVEAIALNKSLEYYVYTQESLQYTVHHLHEFEIYSINNDERGFTL